MLGAPTTPVTLSCYRSALAVSECESVARSSEDSMTQSMMQRDRGAVTPVPISLTRGSDSTHSSLTDRVHRHSLFERSEGGGERRGGVSANQLLLLGRWLLY